jgi:pantoate--beta-alanine ligase
VAAFGEKDFQQLSVIRRMVADLALPTEIVGGPIVRDQMGLALSSRNTFLSPADRSRALSLSASLRAIRTAFRQGETQVALLREIGLSTLTVDAVDYLQIVDATSLQPIDRVTGSARAMVAALLNQTRLIDNLALQGETP